jgi:hypothetical protein
MILLFRWHLFINGNFAAGVSFHQLLSFIMGYETTQPNIRHLVASKRFIWRRFASVGMLINPETLVSSFQ